MLCPAVYNWDQSWMFCRNRDGERKGVNKSASVPRLCTSREQAPSYDEPRDCQDKRPFVAVLVAVRSRLAELRGEGRGPKPNPKRRTTRALDVALDLLSQIVGKRAYTWRPVIPLDERQRRVLASCRAGAVTLRSLLSVSPDGSHCPRAGRVGLLQPTGARWLVSLNPERRPAVIPDSREREPLFSLGLRWAHCPGGSFRCAWPVDVQLPFTTTLTLANIRPVLPEELRLIVVLST